MLISGKARYCKIIGAPRPGYGGQHNEWSFDLVIDKDTQNKLKKLDYPRPFKETDAGEVYIRFKRKELNAKGTANSPIEIIDHHGEPWSGAEIGNGSTLNVSIDTFDNQYKTKTVWVNKVQVWDLVPYTRTEEFPVKSETNAEEETWDE